MAEEIKQKLIDWKLIWVVAAFLAGSLFQAASGWGRQTGSLESLSLQMAEIKGSLSILGEKYASGDKMTTQELQKIEDHLSYNDERLNKFGEDLRNQNAKSR